MKTTISILDPLEREILDGAIHSDFFGDGYAVSDQVCDKWPCWDWDWLVFVFVFAGIARSAAKKKPMPISAERGTPVGPNQLMY
jgi:hypothetical protein